MQKAELNNITEVQEKKKLDIGLILYLFCFMFAPPILPINFIFVLSAFSIIILMRNYRKQYMYVIQKSGIKNFTVLLYLYLVYIALIMVVNIVCGDVETLANYIIIFYRFTLVTPIITSCVVYIILKIEKNGFDIEDLIKHFILAGMIQAVLSMLAFMNHNIREILINIMRQYESTEVSAYIYERRLYGFANGLYDLFGWGTGLLAALPFFMYKRDNKKYLITVPFLLIPPLLNARTGIVIFSCGVAVYILFLYNKNFYSVMKKIILLLVGVLSVYLVFNWIKNNNPITYNWILEGVYGVAAQISNSGERTGGMTTLFSENFWRLPEFPDIIFGVGHSVYDLKSNSRYVHSDVGYVNYLYMGGIVGSVILYGIFFSLFKRVIRRNADKNVKWLLIFLGITIVVFNIKAMAFTHCPATAIILTLLFYTNYNAKKVMN